jgi:hypothetical protein
MCGCVPVTALLFCGQIWAPAWALAREPARVALSWQAPVDAGCTSAQEIQRRVARLTDHTLLLAAAGPSFRIVADLAPRDASWQAHITLLDLHGGTLGTREVQGRLPDCQALDVPAVLVISMLLDDLQQQEEARAQAALGQRRMRDSHLGIGASASAALGLGPSAQLGITLAAEVPVGVPLLFAASSYLPFEQTDVIGRGMSSSSVHAGLSLCPRLVRAGVMDIQLCAGAQAGLAWARAVGLRHSEAGLLPILMLGLEPRLLLELSDGLAAQLSLAANWAAIRPNFEYTIVGDGTRRLTGEPFVLMARIGFITSLPFGP